MLVKNQEMDDFYFHKVEFYLDTVPFLRILFELKH